MAALTRTPDQRARRGLITKASLLLLVAGLANFVLWWFFSKPLVPWLFGPQWVNAIPVFEAMAPLSLAMSIAYLPTTLALANRAYGTLAAVRLVALAVFVVCALLLAPRMTPVTMAWLFQLTLIGQGLVLSLAMVALGSQSRRIAAKE